MRLLLLSLFLSGCSSMHLTTVHAQLGGGLFVPAEISADWTKEEPKPVK